MKAYQDILKNILDTGTWKPNRTKFRTLATFAEVIRHDMRTGFPALTTKKVPIKLVASELEMFINGITSKKFLQDRNNHIWDEWCNPLKVPYSKDDPDIQQKMKDEDDLGPIYGYQWRSFNKPYIYESHEERNNLGVDQLKSIIDTIKSNPSDRRMLCSAWNPAQLKEQALPPCHYMFQVVCNGENFEYIDLVWHQRSTDSFLGLPFDLASYGILLTLIAKETNKIPRYLVGTLGDSHIYENHIEQCKEVISREPFTLPELKINNFTSIYDFKYTDIELVNYVSHSAIKAEIAI